MVGVAGAFGFTLDPHNKGLIAGITLALILIGDLIAARFHIEERQA